MKIRINVTKEVLERSKMCGGNPSNCAIAMATRELFPGASVGLSVICFSWTWTSMPEEATRFIIEFDSNTPEYRVKMKPISFEIEVPESVINEIGIEEVNRVLSTSSTLQLA